MNTRNTQRHQRISVRVAAGASMLGLLALSTACSGEDLAESFIENRVESESGEQIDLDLNDGNFSLQTEDGSMSIDADGNMVINSPEGSAVVNVDDQGNVQMSGVGNDGEAIEMNTDADGNMVINSPDGSAVFNVDDAGNFEANTDEGTFTASSGTDIPAEFPSDISIPGDFTVVGSSVIGDGTESLITLALESSSSAEDASAAMIASLEAGGYERQQATEAPGMVLLTYGNGSQNVIVSVIADDGGPTSIGISVQPN